jgi:hypothetical protein
MAEVNNKIMGKYSKSYYLNINDDYSWELKMSNRIEVYTFYLGNCDKFCKENFRSSIFVVLTALDLDIDDIREGAKGNKIFAKYLFNYLELNGINCKNLNEYTFYAK